jgi:hypothetical protein
MQLNLPVIDDDTMDIAQKRCPHIQTTDHQLLVKYKTFPLPEFSDLVNFSTRNEHPIHRWFFYREGYSPKLVKRLLNKEKINKGQRVLDPFCGGGTTLLVSAQQGIESTGYEINKFSAFASKVKTKSYTAKDIEAIEKHISDIKNIDKFKSSLPLPKLSTLNKLFDKDILEGLMCYKEAILSIKETKIRDILFFGWLTILEPASNYRKGGNGLKLRRANNKKPLKEAFFKKLSEISMDLKYLNHKGFYNDFAEPNIYEDSAVNIKIADKFDISIFSPPYLNCFDYCEVYKVELWMGDFVMSYDELRTLRKSSLTSHLSSNFNNISNHTLPRDILSVIEALKERRLWDNRIPDMIKGYFVDMKKVLLNLFNSLKSGAPCIIVVGNSAYGNMVIPTDIFLCLIAEEVGFVCEGIGIARRKEMLIQYEYLC